MIYVDPNDLTEASERAIQANVTSVVGGAAKIDVTNEARAHLWYEQRFGHRCHRYDVVLSS